MSASMYMRGDLPITRPKRICDCLGPQKYFPDVQNKKRSCMNPGCPRHGSWCTEDFRQAEVVCPWYK